jgi:hypothetical protein
LSVSRWPFRIAAQREDSEARSLLVSTWLVVVFKHPLGRSLV